MSEQENREKGIRPQEENGCGSGLQEGKLQSQKLRELAPELDPLRLGTGWKVEDLSKPQILIESSFGDSHPGSVHLLELAEEAKAGVAEAGADMARDTFVQISATEKLRGTTASIIPCLPGI